MKLKQVQGERKKITDKLHYTQSFLEHSKTEHINSGIMFRVTKHMNSNTKKAFIEWLEAEDIHFEKKPEELKKIMKALFLADHDAGQMEQYELENNAQQVLTFSIAKE